MAKSNDNTLIFALVAVAGVVVASRAFAAPAGSRGARGGVRGSTSATASAPPIVMMPSPGYGVAPPASWTGTAPPQPWQVAAGFGNVMLEQLGMFTRDYLPGIISATQAAEAAKKAEAEAAAKAQAAQAAPPAGYAQFLPPQSPIR